MAAIFDGDFWPGTGGQASGLELWFQTGLFRGT